MGLLSLLVPPTLLTKQTTGTNPIAKVSTSLSLSVVCCVYIKPTNLPQKKRRPGSLTGYPTQRSRGALCHVGCTWPTPPSHPQQPLPQPFSKGKCPRASCVSVSVVFPPPKHPQKQRQKHRQHTEEGTRQTELPHPDLPRRHPLNLLKLKPKGLQEVFFCVSSSFFLVLLFFSCVLSFFFFNGFCLFVVVVTSAAAVVFFFSFLFLYIISFCLRHCFSFFSFSCIS